MRCSAAAALVGGRLSELFASVAAAAAAAADCGRSRRQQGEMLFFSYFKPHVGKEVSNEHVHASTLRSMGLHWH